MKPPNDTLKINLAVFMLAIVAVTSSFYPQMHLWGMDSVAAFPVWLRTGLLLILLIAILPGVAKKTSSVIEAGIESLSNRQFAVSYAALSAILILAFILLSSRNYLQGDGYTVMGHLIGGYAFSPSEPADYLLHFGLARLLGGDKLAVLRSYQVCAYAAGGIFLAGIYFLLKARRDIIIALTLAGAFGVMQFFFGYVESYTFRLIFIFLYLISAISDLHDQKISVRTILFLFLAVIFHLSSLVLVPSFVYLIWNKYRTKRAAIHAVGISGLALGIATLNLYIFAPIRLILIFAPLYPTADTPYSLFSSDHIYDLLNAIMLSSPLFILIGLTSLRGKRLPDGWEITTLAPAILFMILVDPRIGAFRDWDLLSIAAPVILSLLIVRLADSPRGILGVVVPIIIFSMIHTGGWVWWNRHRDDAYGKIKEIIHRDKHYSKDYFQGYDSKGWSVIIYDYYGDADEAVRAAEVRFDGDPKDSRNACNLASYYFARGDTSKAIDFIRLNWRWYINDVGTVSTLGSMLFSAGRYHEIERMYESYIAAGGKDYRLYQDLGYIKEMSGRIDSAMILYDQSCILWEDAPLSNLYDFYLRALKMKYYDIGLSGLERIYTRLPYHLSAPIKSLIEAIASHDYNKADSIALTLSAAPGALRLPGGK